MATQQRSAHGECRGHVAAVYMDKCLVWDEARQWVCTWRGRLKGQQRPTVGDMVEFTPLGEERGEITRFLPRRSILQRLEPHRGRGRPERAHVLAANLDQIVIVASLHQPPFREGLVYRLLVAAHAASLSPLLCVTKLDLDRDGEFAARQAQFSALAVPVIGTCLQRPETLQHLADALRGKTSLLVGHSGVGKSSLINALSDQELRVGEVGFFKDRGRHTTSTARLIPLRTGGLAIDAPGVREFGLHGLTPELLAAHFPGLQRYQGQCRFRDCRHGAEAGCAVREAVARGDCPTELYQGYAKLLAEISAP